MVNRGRCPEPGALATCLSNARLHLILMTTESCNFRCVYCYERFGQGRMKPWVVAGLKRLLERRAAELEQLILSWFGGEPLLAPDIIEEVMLHVLAQRERNPSLLVVSDITTNAYLLRQEVAARLLGLEVRQFQISFDGPPACHDRKRVLPGGRGTFDRIWGNLRGLRDLGGPFRAMIRLHVDRENEPAMPEFLDMVAAEFGNDPRFEVFARRLGRFGGPNDGFLPTFDSEDDAGAAEERVRALAEARGLRLTAQPAGVPICYSAQGNSFLLRADGTLNKCTIALDHPANQVGNLREDGTVRIDGARVQPWLRGLFSGIEEELRCPMHGLADRGSAPVSPA